MKRKGNIDSPDRRVKYTKMVIRQSFLTLISEKPIEKISVTDICVRADLNRGTFYAYYKDPSDLFDQIKSSLYDELKAPLSQIPDTSGLYDLLVGIFQSILANKDLCSIILSNTGDKFFLNKILDLVKQRFINTWHAKLPSIPLSTLEYLYIFTANGSTGVLKAWLANGNKDTPEKMARLVEQMSTNAMLSYLES